jgi:hypothetical protein
MTIIKETIFQDFDFKLNENVKKLRIIHFNDAYNIESRNTNPCGGGKIY